MKEAHTKHALIEAEWVEMWRFFRSGRDEGSNAILSLSKGAIFHPSPFQGEGTRVRVVR